MQKVQGRGFTLVELIVVITILAILWTIAFMAFTGYSKNSRDSVRSTDLRVITSSLELFQLNTWFLPEPTGGTDITYSWGTVQVWTQGTFWDTVIQNIGNLSKKPVDPLFWTEYTYSVTKSRKEFEVGWVVEWDSQVSFLVNQASAQNVIQQALIQWNYNGKVLKTELNGVMYIFALPSIITSDISMVDVETQVLNKLLSYNGYGTIPASFSGSATSVADSFDFGWVGINVVVFSWAIEDLNDINKLKTFTINLQNAYSGSVLVNNQDYATLMAIDPENDNLIESEIAYLINNNLWWDITADTINLWWQGGGQQTPVNYAELCTVNWEIRNSTSVYGTCSSNDIIVCSWTATWYILSACNVWTDISWTWASSYWYYFQWGNNGWTSGGNVTPNPTLVDASWYGPGNYYNSTIVIACGWAECDWSLNQNDNLWWWVTNSYASKQWPCLNWYHIPSETEWTAIFTSWWWGVSGGNTMRDVLKLPKAWSRNWLTWVMGWVGNTGLYWASTANGPHAARLRFDSGYATSNDVEYRWVGNAVRCIKN